MRVSHAYAWELRALHLKEESSCIWRRYWCHTNFILEVEPSLVRGDSLRKEHFFHKEGSRTPTDHCCICGSSTCDIGVCPCLSESTFSSLHTNACWGGTLQEVSRSETNESYRPLLQTKSSKRKTLPSVCSLRHVTNVDMMLECEHCGLWWLLHSQKKLSEKEREELNWMNSLTSHLLVVLPWSSVTGQVSMYMWQTFLVKTQLNACIIQQSTHSSVPALCQKVKESRRWDIEYVYSVHVHTCTT